MRSPFSIKWIYFIERKSFGQKYKFRNKNDMVSTWRNFKNTFSRPLFTIIYSPEMLKFHPYSILTGDTRVEFVIYCVLRSSFVFSGLFVVGDFVPTRTLPYPMYIITVNIHMDQILYLGGFCPGGILSQQQLYSMYSITVNIHIDQHMFWEEFVLGRILSREGLSSLL